jgi:hypothetical protein
MQILLLVTSAGYVGLWHAGFVWDDIPLIVQNRALADASFGALFTSDLWADTGAGDVASGYYRPMVLLSFAVDRSIFGLEPAGYHLHSLLWHLLSMVMLHRLVRPLMSPGAALLAVAFFGLHPAQSEVVAWIAARNDLMATALGFGALSLLWDGTTPSIKRACVACLITIAAAMSKETAFTLPVLLGVADWARGQRSGFWQRQAPVVLGVGVVLVWRAVLGLGEAAVPSGAGVDLLLSGAWELLGGYGASLVSPWPLSSAKDLSWIGLQPGWRTAMGLGFFGALGLSWATAASEQRRVAGLGLVWAAVLLGITLVPTADKGGYGDRFLYWPLAGFGIALGALLGHQWKVLVPAVVVPAMLMLHLRMPDWVHDRALWGAAVRDVPSPTNEVSLGHALTLHARHKRAHVSFVSALAGEGIDLDACGAVVGSAMRMGLPRQALRMGEWALARGCVPTGPMKGWLATAAALGGDWEKASRWAHGNPSDPRHRDLIVRAVLARRDGDEAGYAAIESDWVGADPLAPQVEALLVR